MNFFHASIPCKGSNKTPSLVFESLMKEDYESDKTTSDTEENATALKLSQESKKLNLIKSTSCESFLK